MNKKLKIFILLLFLFQIATAKEPTMAILVNIKSNDIQDFKIGNYQFQCLPYGISGIDELYRESTFNSACKNSIKDFYKRRTELKFFTTSKMTVMQSYVIEIKNNRCIINISGEKSLSEFLLEEGLAVVKPFIKDKEYKYYFEKSQQSAKYLRKGIWRENITRECVANIYKK